MIRFSSKESEGLRLMPNILMTGATKLMSLLEPLANLFEVHAISRSKANDEIANITWHHADLSDDFDVVIACKH